jgi:uncharacterized protein involved in response to NO
MSLRATFAAPFRIFFLSVGVLAVLAIPVWIAMLSGAFVLPSPLDPYAWHQHEMIFGLLEAAVAGFLLTAVGNWTQTAPLGGSRLLLLWSVWILARLAMALGGGLDERLLLVPDLAFVPLVLADAGVRIVRTRQWRQLIVLAVLGALWCMHAGFHFVPERSFAGPALVAVLLLMSVIGGRITPAFSGNWLRLQGRDASAVRTSPVMDRLVIASLAALFFATVLDAGRWWICGLAFAASLATAGRLWLWRGWLTRREPLLWILHVAGAWIPVSLFLFSGSAAGCVAPSAWMHAAAAGAMASLILGVMTRVALGHTGRLLVLPRGVAAAYVLILGAGAVRVATALRVVDWSIGIHVAATLWTAAFALFLLRYVPILCGPRVDGRAG